MSHFSCLVVARDLEAALQPFHEFECTGTNDQYVQDVDITADLQADISSHDGPAPEALQDALENYGLENRVIADESEADRDDTHKYGFAVVRDGVLVKAIDRTNPNKKWDWWTVGGRWSGKLINKSGARVDQALAGDVDWDQMIQAKLAAAEIVFDKVRAVISDRSFSTWPELYSKVQSKEITIDEARDLYNAQDVVKEVTAAEVLGWMDSATDLHKIARTERGAYVEYEAMLNASTWAMLLKGEWSERGEMGWFGMSDSTPESESAALKKFWQTVREIPTDMPVSVVDCHI